MKSYTINLFDQSEHSKLSFIMTTNQSKSTLKWIDYSDDSQQSAQEKEETISIPSLKQQTLSKHEIRQSEQKEPEIRKVRSEYQTPSNSNLSVEESKKMIEQWEEQKIWLFVQYIGLFKECLFSAMKNDPNKKIRIHRSYIDSRAHDLLVPTELAKNLLTNDSSAIIDYLKKLGEQVIIPNFSEQQLKTAKQAKIVIHERNFKKKEGRDRQPYQSNGNRNYNNRNRQQGGQRGYDRKGKTRYQNNGDYQQKRNGNREGRRQGDQKKKTYVNKQTGEAPQNKKNLIKKTISEQQRKYTKKQAAIRGQELAFFRNRAPEQVVVENQQKRQKVIKQQVAHSKIQVPIKQQKDSWGRKQVKQDQTAQNTKKKLYKSKEEVQISLGTKKSTAEEEAPKSEKPNERNYNRNYQNDREQRNYHADREAPIERNYKNDKNYQNQQKEDKEEKGSKTDTFNKKPYQKRNYKEKDSNNYKPKYTKKQSGEDDKLQQKKPQKPKNQNRFAAMMSDDSDN